MKCRKGSALRILYMLLNDACCSWLLLETKLGGYGCWQLELQGTVSVNAGDDATRLVTNTAATVH